MKPARTVLIALTVLSSTMRLAADQNPFLAEATKFTVVAENLPTSLAESGLTVADIQERTEFSCRKNGLPVNAEAKPWLYVRVSGTRVRTGGRVTGYTYNVHLYFNQTAKTPERGLLHTVTSWHSRGTCGITSAESLRDDIKGAIQDEVEEFANVWMASHQKQ
jgi:hypothetical protein